MVTGVVPSPPGERTCRGAGIPSDNGFELNFGVDR